MAVFLWVYVNTGPGISFTDTGSIFSSAVMVPLTGYLVALVSGKTGNSITKANRAKVQYALTWVVDLFCLCIND